MFDVAHAQALLRMGEFARCLDVTQAALPHAQATLGVADPTARHLRVCLAIALQMLRRFDEATVHWEVLLSDDRYRLGVADPTTLGTAHALFNTRLGAGDRSACRTIYDDYFAPFCGREPHELSPAQVEIRGAMATHTDWLAD